MVGVGVTERVALTEQETDWEAVRVPVNDAVEVKLADGDDDVDVLGEGDNVDDKLRVGECEMPDQGNRT